MRRAREDSPRFETHHLTCMVCGALPGMTCIDEDFTELEQVHPSRRLTIAERNWKTRNGWEAPELVARRRRKAKEARKEAGRAARAARAIRSAGT